MIFFLSLISTIVLCLITSFSNFAFLVFNFFLCLCFGIIFYNIVVFSVCKFLEKKYYV